MRNDKAIKFMNQARFIAKNFSKDPSTKVGAVLVDPVDFTLLTQGYNGMPRGVDESRPERQARPLKYAFYEHAERNAVFNLARRKLKGSIAISTTEPSLSCARALISVGASEVFFPCPAEMTEELQTAMELFIETGVRVGGLSAGQAMQDGAADRHLRKIADFAVYAEALPELLGKDPRGSATLFLTPGDYTQVTQGYSGMPRGADDQKTERYLGEQRDMWVESSVRNAIYNSVRAELKGSVALVTATTCVECARAFAAVGVSHVFYTSPTDDFKSRWGPSIGTALNVLHELGVKVTEMPAEES